MSIEQSVYCEIIGQGEDLVLLHGWGVNSAVWQPVVERLSQHFRLFLVDLPGFGSSAPLADYSLKSISEVIAQVVPDTAIWCGWSLGGLIATYTAINYPQRVSKLIQICSSVKFVAEDSWSGVDSTVFAAFLQGLESNSDKTLTRFIALQAMGCASSRKDIATLKALLCNTPKADQKALVAGLNLLAETDFRQGFSGLSLPCLSFFGQFDGLVPITTSAQMRSLLPSARQHVFENSSHAPFISEPDAFLERMMDFIDG